MGPANLDLEKIEYGPAGPLTRVACIHAERAARDWRWYHETYTFCTVFKTRGPLGHVNRYRQWTHVPEPGDTLLFEPGEVHSAAGRGGAGDFGVLLVDAREVRQAVRELSGSSQLPHFKHFATPTAFASFCDVHRLLREPASHALEIEQRFSEALTQVLSHCTEPGGPSPRPFDSPSVHRAVEYIHDLTLTAPADHLRLEDLTRESGAPGKFALCRDFKRELGISPYAYWKARKMTQAQNDLRQGQKVIQVAQTHGYDSSAFSREFHKLVGVAPSVYRAAFVNDNGHRRGR